MIPVLSQFWQIDKEALLEKFFNGATKITDSAVDMVFLMVRLHIVQELLLALLCLLFIAVPFVIMLKWSYTRFVEDASYFLKCIPTMIIFIIGICNYERVVPAFSPYSYVGLYKPEIYIAKGLYDKVVKK